MVENVAVLGRMPVLVVVDVNPGVQRRMKVVIAAVYQDIVVHVGWGHDNRAVEARAFFNEGWCLVLDYHGRVLVRPQGGHAGAQRNGGQGHGRGDDGSSYIHGSSPLV